METKLSASEAARSLSDIINRVKYRGEEFIIERGGEAVCKIVPVTQGYFSGSELANAYEKIPKPDPEYWEAVADTIRKSPPLPESPWSH